METKFTPGPWRAEQGAGFHVDQIVITAPSMNARSPLARVSNITGDAWPDAHLIAAAPDLYASCAEFLPILERQLDSINPGGAAEGSNAYRVAAERVGRLRAALAKARGEQ